MIGWGVTAKGEVINETDTVCFGSHYLEEERGTNPEQWSADEQLDTCVYCSRRWRKGRKCDEGWTSWKGKKPWAWCTEKLGMR